MSGRRKISSGRGMEPGIEAGESSRGEHLGSALRQKGVNFRCVSTFDVDQAMLYFGLLKSCAFEG